MSRSVLIVGGAGYIGSQTAKAVALAGYTPVVFDNLTQGHRWAVKWGPLEVGDINNPTAIREVIQRHDIKAVVHFASYAYVGESMVEPRKYFHNNVVNTLHLLDAVLDTGVRTIVFSSSCTVYGNVSNDRIFESSPTRPVNPYGESKLMAERMFHWYQEAYQIRWIALRYFNAAGADPEGDLGEDHKPETHLIPLAISRALGHGPRLEIYGTDYPTPDGTAVRDYIHVADLADAHVRALRYLEGGGASEALNLGTGKGSSVRDVLAAIERVSGQKVPFKEVSRRHGDPAHLVADAARAMSILKWQPRYSMLDTIIEHAWRWHLRSPLPD